MAAPTPQPAASKRRRWPWLLAFVVLLAGAAWLMGQGEPPEKESAVEKVNFPNHLRRDEYQRMEKRRTLAIQAIAQAQANAPPPQPQRPRDPLLAALPSGKGKTAVVFEANALRNSPVGELLLDCMRAKRIRNGGSREVDPFDDLRKHSGIDVLTDLDRVAITSDGAMISGNFQNARWDEMFGKATASAGYGDKGTIYTPPTSDRPKGKHDIGAVGVWNNTVIVSGETEDDVKRIIDRLEGRAPDEPTVLNESDTYGEVYGVIAPGDLAELLGPEQKDLAQKLSETADEVKLHVDASNDVAMVANLTGPDGQKVSDLGRTLGGVLSLARIKAQTDGDQDLADLLDFARVRPSSGSFQAELALPMSVLQQKLAWCRDALDAGPAIPSADTTGAASP